MMMIVPKQAGANSRNICNSTRDITLRMNLPSNSNYDSNNDNHDDDFR